MHISSQYKQLAAILALRLLYIALTLAMTIFLTHALGVEAFGAFTFLYSIVLLGALIVKGGWLQLIIRETATNHAEGAYARITKTISEATSSSILASLLVCAILALCAALGYLPIYTIPTVMIAIVAVPLLALSNINEGLLRGLQKQVHAMSIEMAIRPAAFLALGILFFLSLRSEFGLFTVFLSHSLACVIAFIASMALRTRMTRGFPRPEKRQSLKATKISKILKTDIFPLSVITWLSNAALHFQILFTGLLAGVATSGELRIALQLSALVGLGLAIINAYQAPALSIAWRKQNIEELQRLASEGCRISLAFALPVATVLYFFHPQIISLLFGSQFSIVDAPLTILIAAHLLNAAFGSVGLILISAKETTTVAWIQVVNMVVLLLASLAFVPSFGATGMAVSILLCYLFFNLTSSIFVYKKTGVICSPFLPQSKRI